MENGSSLPKIAKKQLFAKELSRSFSVGKNQEDLRQRLEKSSEKTGEDKPAVSSSIIGVYQSRTGSRLETEFSLIVSDLNRRELQIKQSKNDLISERKILKRLQKAFLSEDSEKIEKAQNDLLALKNVQKERQDQIIREQQFDGDSRLIKLTDTEKKSVKFPIIESTKVKPDVPENQAQIDLEYERIEKDDNLLSDSEQSAMDARAELSLIFTQIKQSYRNPLKSAPNSIEGAEFLANNISEQASFLSPDEIIRAAFGKAEGKELSINISLLS